MSCICRPGPRSSSCRLPPPGLGRLGAWLAGEGTSPWSPQGKELERYTPEEMAALLSRSKLDLALKLLLLCGPRGEVRQTIESSLVDRWDELSAAQTAVLARLRGEDPPPEGSSWASPDWQAAQRRALRSLLETPIEVPATSLADATQDDVTRWLAEARSPDEEAARRALSRLAEEPGGAWRALALELVETGTPRVRHHVLRLIRRTLPQQDTLTAARSFLDDEDASARRTAIRIVCHGRDRDAIPRVVALLLDPVAWARREALEGLALMAEDATPWVVRARDHARPDQARIYEQALSRLRGRKR